MARPKYIFQRRNFLSSLTLSEEMGQITNHLGEIEAAGGNILDFQIRNIDGYLKMAQKRPDPNPQYDPKNLVAFWKEGFELEAQAAGQGLRSVDERELADVIDALYLTKTSHLDRKRLMHAAALFGKIVGVE